MRGGLVAAGVLLVVLGLSWWLVLSLDEGRFFAGIAGTNVTRAIWLVCVVPLIFLVVGGMIFIAGLVGKSAAELAAMRAMPPYAAQPPPVVWVQQPQSPPQPHLGRGVRRQPPPPGT